MTIGLAGCAGLPDQRLANEALKRGRQAEATYRAAADTSPRAQARLGRLLVAKPGATEAEHHEAETLLKKAFANGEGNTLIPLAMLYLQFPQSFPEVNAQRQIDQWRAAGYPEAGLAQVLLYRTQNTYDQHLDEVEKICKAALNSTDICYVELATVYQKRAQPEQQAETAQAVAGGLQARQRGRPARGQRGPRAGRLEPRSAGCENRARAVPPGSAWPNCSTTSPTWVTSTR